MSGSGDVRATLNYLHRTDRRPYLYMFDPPEGVAAAWGEIHPVPDVPVRNGRLLPQPPSLHANGFEFHVQDTAVTDFYDPDQIARIYYPEIERLLHAVTGAEKIVIFDHTLRSIEKFKAGIKGMRPPTMNIHNDYTEASGPERVRDHLPPEEAERRLKHRFLEINVWRPIRGPLQDNPLAVCDSSTLAPEDLMASDLIYPDRVTETYSVAYSPGHRWYYYPGMQRNEALVFKGFDSDRSAKARFTPHTAFNDTTAPADRLPRESIEVRALAFLPLK